MTVVHLETFSEYKIPNFFADDLEKKFVPYAAIVSGVTKNIIGVVENADKSLDFVFSDRKSITRVAQTLCLGPGNHQLQRQQSHQTRDQFGRQDILCCR